MFDVCCLHRFRFNVYCLMSVDCSVLLDGCWGMRFIVCRVVLLFVVGDVLVVGCFVLFVLCRVLFVVCSLLCVGCCVSCCSLFDNCCVLFVR